MKEYTLESPFDPKWEMTPEQIAEVFSLDKNKKYKTTSIDEVDGGIKGQAVPELNADNNVISIHTVESQDRYHKLLLDQNYLSLLISIQDRLNKLYEDRAKSTAEIDKDFIVLTTALKTIRANATSLYDLALKSNSDVDIVMVKDVLIELAKVYN